MTGPLSDFQCDVLREVGNVGAGNAATALAALLGEKVKMKIPYVSWTPFDSVAERFGGPDRQVAGILLSINSGAPATILVMFPWDQACRLLEVLCQVRIEQASLLDEMSGSALQEVGNILAGSYLTSLSGFTGLTLVPGVPALAVDMAGAVLDYVLAEFGQVADQALLIETEFEAQGQDILSYFFLAPQPDTLQAIFDSLGVDAK